MKKSIRSEGARLSFVVLVVAAALAGTIATGFAEGDAQRTATGAMDRLPPARHVPQAVLPHVTYEQPHTTSCYTIRQTPIGLSWCKPSELALRAGQDADEATTEAAARLQEQERKLPNGVEIVCTGSTGPSVTRPDADASAPTVDNGGSSVTVTAPKPSATAPSVDRGDRECHAGTE